MQKIFRFLGLVVVLNIIRYVVAGVIEMPLILPPLFKEMEENATYFNTAFATVDWLTSYFYNFIMWLCMTWIFHLARPALHGREMIKSLKVFGLGWLFFASVSAIYMNHYSHPKAFYLWNILDGIVAFGIVAVANGLLYRRMMGIQADLRES